MDSNGFGVRCQSPDRSALKRDNAEEMEIDLTDWPVKLGWCWQELAFARLGYDAGLQMPHDPLWCPESAL